jgi:hypothetical protein
MAGWWWWTNEGGEMAEERDPALWGDWPEEWACEECDEMTEHAPWCSWLPEPDPVEDE